MCLKPRCNVPHFKSKLKQLRSSGYTFDKCLSDICDNVINKSKYIYIKFNTNDVGKLLSISFTDVYKNGFENINENNENNPFNMGHSRVGHNNDDETSEFGIGFKAASMNLGEKLIVYTHVPKFNKYYQIEFDFNLMTNIEDPTKSYEYTCFNEITKDIYTSKHGYDYGSTLIIENIRDTIIDNFDEGKCSNYLSDTFSRTELNIYINNKLINSTDKYYEHNHCKPFNRNSTIYIDFENKKPPLIKINEKYYYYNDKLEVKNKNDIKDTINYHENTSEKIEITSTYTYYIPKITNGIINLYRNNRKYGVINHNSSNGTQNYTYHELNYKSKKFNKYLGLTFNKTINLDNNNFIIKIIYSIIKNHQKKYSADTHSKKFKDLEKVAIDNNIINNEDNTDNDTFVVATADNDDTEVTTAEHDDTEVTTAEHDDTEVATAEHDDTEVAASEHNDTRSSYTR